MFIPSLINYFGSKTKEIAIYELAMYDAFKGSLLKAEQFKK